MPTANNLGSPQTANNLGSPRKILSDTFRKVLTWGTFDFEEYPTFVMLLARVYNLMPRFITSLRNLDPCIHRGRGGPCETCPISSSKKLEVDAVEKGASEVFWEELRSWKEFKFDHRSESMKIVVVNNKGEPHVYDLTKPPCEMFNKM